MKATFFSNLNGVNISAMTANGKTTNAHARTVNTPFRDIRPLTATTLKPTWATVQITTARR